MAPIILRPNEKILVKFEIFEKYFSKKIFFSLFLTFWPKYLALVDNFQRQEDLILWNFLYESCEKKCQLISAVCLHFSKKIKCFQILLSLG